MKKKIVIGTLSAVLIAGSVPLYENETTDVYAKGEESAVALFAAEEGSSSVDQPELTQAPPSTEVPEPTQAPLPTEEPAPTQAPLPTEAPSPTQAPLPTEAPSPTQAPLPTETPVPTQAPAPTEGPEPTQAPSPTEEPAPTQVPSPTESPAPTETPSLAEILVAIQCDPEDAQVLVLDSEGELLEPEEGAAYHLKQGMEYEIYARKEGYQEYHEKITADPAVTQYHVKLLSNDTSLKGLYISSSDTYGKGILKLSPKLSPEKEKYSAVYDGERQSLNIWPETTSDKAEVKVYALSGVKASTVEKDETITGTKDKKDRPYWKIFFGDQEKEAKVRIQITAEDGTQKNLYVTLTLTDTAAPLLKKISASRISTEAASVVYKTEEKGNCYYQVIEAGGTVPDFDTETGGTEVLAGTNTISLSGLSAGEKDIVIWVKDAAGNVSEPLVMRIPDIKNNSQSNLVHGSDHGGNKSQATIPGKGGEGSLSNLKQVAGKKDTVKNLKTYINARNSNEKSSQKSDEPVTIEKSSLFSLFVGILNGGKNEDGESLKMLTAKAAADSKKNNSGKLSGRTEEIVENKKSGSEDAKKERTASEETVENVASKTDAVSDGSETRETTASDSSETKEATDAKSEAASFSGSTEEEFSFTTLARKAARSWRQTSILTKLLLLFAVAGLGFLLFWAGARRHFRKGRLQIKGNQ